MKIPKEQQHKIPWHMVRLKCARCGGHHAPWWGTVRAPSCTDGSARQNSTVMFLETMKALGR
jgi:hypothetical protein